MSNAKHRFNGSSRKNVLLTNSKTFSRCSSFITHRSIVGGSNQLFDGGGVDGHDEVGESNEPKESERHRSVKRFRSRDECMRRFSNVDEEWEEHSSLMLTKKRRRSDLLGNARSCQAREAALSLQYVSMWRNHELALLFLSNLRAELSTNCRPEGNRWKSDRIKRERTREISVFLYSSEERKNTYENENMNEHKRTKQISRDKKGSFVFCFSCKSINMYRTNAFLRSKKTEREREKENRPTRQRERGWQNK